MNTRFWKIISCICVLVIALNGVFIKGIKAVKAEEQSPYFFANPSGKWVYAFNWPDPNTLLTLTRVGPSMTSTNGYFDLSGQAELVPGEVVTVSGEGIEKSLTITNVTITNIDVEDDSMSGTASPNGSVCVVPDNATGNARCTIAGEDGTWHITPEEGGFEFAPGVYGWVGEFDNDGDITRMNWSIPNPTVRALLSENRIETYGWPLDKNLELTIVDGPQKYTTSLVTTPCSWDSSCGYASFELGPDFTLAPDQLITVSDGNITKTLNVMDLYVETYDPTLKTVSGHSDQGSNVQVNMWIDGGSREVITDLSGNWQAVYDTFTDPFLPWYQGDATVSDDDGDSTVYRINYGNIFAYLPDRVELQNVTKYRKYDLTIDDPSNGPGVDYSDSVFSQLGEGDTHGDVVYQLENFSLKPGDLVTVSSGHDARTLIVIPKGSISFDPVNDVVSGVNQPDNYLSVDSPNWRTVKTDSSGQWSIDYKTVGPNNEPPGDVYPGMNGCVYEADRDNDFTANCWNIPNPNFSVRANTEQVEAYEWTLGDTLTVSVNGNNFNSKTVEGMAPWDPNTTYVSFDLAGKVDIKAGDTLSVSNGVLTRTTVVTDLAITGNDITTDTISGKAQPGLIVDTWACDQETCYSRHVMPDYQGNWTADFAHPGILVDEQNSIDLLGGTWVDSQQTDEDGDRTMFGLSLPNTLIEVRAQYDQVVVWEWTVGDKVTISVNDHVIQQAVIAKSTREDGLNAQEFNLSGLVDIKPGDKVSASNGSFTKTTIVTGLKFTDIDNATDIVTGKAAPGSPVNIYACGSEGCFDRDVITDGSGNWQADFSQPGGNGQNPVDLTYNVWVDSSQSDEDNDRTVYGVSIPYPVHHIFTYNIKTKVSTQVTKNPDFREENPNWAPTGKKFVHDVFTFDGTQFIAVTDLVTHTTVPIKGGEGGDDPVWSPNGLWIAYNSVYTNTANIYIIPFKGGRKTLVHENGISPAWSPSSQRIVFVDQGEGGKIRTISYLGTKEITVAESGYNPAWSPDGRWIAYELDGNIWKVRVDSLGRPMARSVQLTFMNGWESQPAWSADSTTIIFQHGLDYDANFDTIDIWKVPASGGNPSIFFGNPVYGDFDPDYLDNAFIAYCQYVEQLNPQMQIR